MKTAAGLQNLMLPHIRGLERYQGVASMDSMVIQSGVPADKVIRLNGNENPYGPSPKALQALGDFQNYNHYPDQDQKKLRQVLSDYVGFPSDHVVVGNGSDEIIDLLMRMFLGAGDNVVIPSPTFGMYAVSAAINGAQAVSVPLDDNFDLDVASMLGAVTPDTKGFFIPSPNNPTGNLVSQAHVCSLLDTGLLVVMDEAYYEFCGATFLPLLEKHPNLVVIRSFSKWAGLAGLRIGFGVMHPDIALTMFSVKPPFNVTQAAEVALVASLEDRSILLERVRKIVAERDRMIDLLNDVPGIKPWPSQANFILIQLPTGRGKEIYDGLCSRGIFLRDYDSPRLRDHLRMSVGLPNETDAVVTALSDLVKP